MRAAVAVNCVYCIADPVRRLVLCGILEAIMVCGATTTRTSKGPALYAWEPNREDCVMSLVLCVKCAPCNIQSALFRIQLPPLFYHFFVAAKEVEQISLF